VRERTRGIAVGAVAAVLAAILGVGASTGPAEGAAAASGTPADSPSPSSGGQAPVRVVAATDDDIHAAAVAAVAAMSLDQKARAVVMGHIPTTNRADLAAYMADNGLGGFILMGANIPGGESALRRITAALTVDPALPPLIAVDEEGGDVTRLPWDDFAGSTSLKHDPPADTAGAFLARGALVQRAGIGVNFGIVADETDDPGAFIYRRALGTTPDAAAARVTAALQGEGAQVLSTVKHFPGHGAASGDSHASIPTTSMSKAKWASTDAVPFQAAVKAGVPLLMFGHLRYSAVDKAPASLSAAWHAIARDELGFQGVAITDDLGMLQASGESAYRDPVKNAVAAIKAGNDMVLAVMFTTSSSAKRVSRGIAAAVESGSLTQERLDEAATRVTDLRLRLAGSRGLVPCADCQPVG
jgi:beta-N-acetylhexosaminidase